MADATHNTRRLPSYLASNQINETATAALSDAELRAAQRKGTTAAAGSRQQPQAQAPSLPASAIPVGLEEIVRNLHERTWASLDLGAVQER